MGVGPPPPEIVGQNMEDLGGKAGPVEAGMRRATGKASGMTSTAVAGEAGDSRDGVPCPVRPGAGAGSRGSMTASLGTAWRATGPSETGTENGEAEAAAEVEEDAVGSGWWPLAAPAGVRRCPRCLVFL